MAEAKRRKSLDSNYGKKSYRIEFLDYKSWKSEITQEDFQQISNELGEIKLKEDLYNKLVWGGKIIIENNSYTFTFSIMIDEEPTELNLQITGIENKKHERIIDNNNERIATDILDIIMSEIKDLYLDFEQEYFDEDDDVN